jgi:hypothetical protein
MKMDNTRQSEKKRQSIIGKVVGGIVLVLGLILAGIVALLPKRRQIVVQSV